MISNHVKSNKQSVTSKSKRRVHDLKFLSWNIHDMRLKEEGLKSSLKEFMEILLQNDLICLQETKEPVKIADYRCYNSNRKSSRSGGVCIGVKNDISKGVVPIDTSCCEDVVAVKLKKWYFGLPNDIALINIYDSPNNSSYKKNLTEDLSTLEKVADIIQRLNTNTQLAIMGDLNARSGSEDDTDEPHFDPCSSYQQELLPDLPKRSNKDLKLNSNGKPFIEFIKANGLVILNGRTLGDIFGEMTCLKYNGCSVVDYMCTSANLYNNVRKMEVCKFSPLSDHYPLQMTLKLGQPNSFIMSSAIPSFYDAPRSFKWVDSEDKTGSAYLFKGAQDAASDSIMKLLESDIRCAEDVVSVNNKVIELYNSLATKALKLKSNKRTNKKKWYDWDCRAAKRNLNKEAALSSNNPNNEELRFHYHRTKAGYKNITKSKKAQFQFDMNSRIENGQTINWKSFKGLQEFHKDDDSFDTLDLYNFFIFFKDLYKKRCTKDSHGDNVNSSPAEPPQEVVEAVNKPFSAAEISIAIGKLKSNKGVSADLISNEMLKYSKIELRGIIKMLFNKCLEFGIYPWSSSLTTPLHKKGDKENPDNYRAITLGSCLGKLFSALLLDRLSSFRRKVCPDEPNQLGFCPGSQTSDHILTLKTLIEKYVSKDRRRLYTCFVDYRKAFDRVCRDALLYKLSHIGFTGNIFRCIQQMYKSSSTRIKLIKKISDAIDVRVGTEQGHPLSPELFKLFIHDLSVELNDEVISGSYPDLMGTRVNHLLWADDLILIALNKESLEQLLQILSLYVDTWELEINISKTNIMVFNTSGKILKESHGFVVGTTVLEPVKNYTYLGITFSLNGSFKVAISQLTSKARRAYFQLKRTLDTRALSIKSMFILFDSLIKPILTYASQIWLPYTSVGKSLISINQNDESANAHLIVNSAKDCFELLHLRFLKWCLGVHKKASNIGCYGDTGRVPIGISVIDSSLKYFRRVSSLSTSDPNSLVGKSFLEQQQLNLDWFRTWNSVSEATSDQLHGQSLVMSKFTEEWESKRLTQNKLTFYNNVKTSFGFEHYLVCKNATSRKSITRFRLSAHDLNIERGRYIKKGKQPSLTDRVCRFCCLEEDRSNLELLEVQLVDYSPIIESEQHVLTECPGYHHLRMNLSDHLKTQLLLLNYNYIFAHPILAEELGKYLNKSFRLRNPNKKC